MATLEECRDALKRFAANLAERAARSGNKLDFDRTIACRVTDLDVAFHGRLADGQIIDLTDGDDPKAKLRLTATADDLIALVDGNLPVASAWASGRLKIDASVLDLLKLRKLL
jgi:putative sterol carrier protein